MAFKKAKIEFSTIVENSPHIIFYTDSKGNLEYANPAVSAASGYTEKEIKRGGFSLLFGKEAVSKIRNEYIPATIKEGIARKEADLICKDGSKRNLNVTSFVMKDGIIGGIAVDLTELHKLEAKLREEKEKAEAANRAKSDFLSNMSHEMRTPMNAIIGMTEIARNTKDNERKKYALNKVEEASKHLLGIINDVLDMSKIEANKFDMSIVEFDLRLLLQKTVSFVKYVMDGKRHLFTMNINDDVPNFYFGDDQRLTQVITNLLSNAVKFTPEGGNIGLSVSLTEADKGRDVRELCFKITDTGIGIPCEKQKLIFCMFEQGDKSTTRKYGGTGLGLSISRHIVELMGGEIHVESKPGMGSQFIFTVKLLQIDENSSIGELEEITEEETAYNKFAGKKILIAEDIEINREILVYMLEDIGLETDTAENGKEILEKYKANPSFYDVIFMDVQMPEMDGIEATKQIRKFESELAQQPENPSLELAQQTPRQSGYARRVPIVAMTANVFKEDIDACIAAGMDDHVGKPLDKEIVLEKLHRYLI